MRHIDPGKFRLGRIELSSDFHPTLELLIDDFVGEINIYENLFQDSISGNVIVSDNRNLLGKLPVIGYETIKIVYFIDENLPGGAINSLQYIRKFKIHSITDYQKQSATVALYSINFRSDEYFMNLTTRLSKSYRSTSISNIASLVFDELKSEKSFVVDSTIVSQDLIIPNWKPFTALNWLAVRAISDSYDGANYVFYENKNGYNFVSLEGLFERGLKEKNIPNYTQPSKNFVLSPEVRTSSFSNIMQIHYDTGLDVAANLFNGMYASKVIEHDIVKRTFKINEFNYSETFDSYKSLNKGSLDDSRANGNFYSEKSDALVTYVPKHTKKYNNTYNYSDNIEKSIQIRRSQLQQLSNCSKCLQWEAVRLRVEEYKENLRFRPKKKLPNLIKNKKKNKDLRERR